MAKKNVSKQKKINVRVDFTPMVDMMMLLITFFMLCTTLAKPQTMELGMPSNDKNLTDEEKSVTKASYTITIYVAGNDRIFYVKGVPDYDNPESLVETTWGRKGIREVLLTHLTEDNTQPVLDITKAVVELDREKTEKNLPDSTYSRRLSALKRGELPDGKKISTMTIIIKATDNATYQNVIDALDEMQLCYIGKYVLDQVNDDDKELLAKKGAQ